jgi:hypothetical protein
MKNQILVMAYCIYLPVVIGLTWYVAHTLFNNAKIFMMDIFNGKLEIAMSTNKLFEVGFYLINVGFAFLIMRIDGLGNHTQMIETLSTKIGGYAIYLGVMLFLNMYLFFRGRKVSRQHRNQNTTTQIVEVNI